MEIKRKSISKKTRFEVFKRDNFTCQYCSAKPPKVPLEVDHITPVCKWLSVKNFIQILGLEEVEKSMEKACNKMYHNEAAIKYFCGIFWNIIKEQEAN